MNALVRPGRSMLLLLAMGLVVVAATGEAVRVPPVAPSNATPAGPSLVSFLASGFSAGEEAAFAGRLSPALVAAIAEGSAESLPPAFTAIEQHGAVLLAAGLASESSMALDLWLAVSTPTEPKPGEKAEETPRDPVAAWTLKRLEALCGFTNQAEVYGPSVRVIPRWLKQGAAQLPPEVGVFATLAGLLEHHHPLRLPAIQAVIAAFDGRVMGESSALRDAGPASLAGVVESLMLDLDRAHRESWFGALVAAFASDDAAIAALRPTDLLPLARLLDQLDQMAAKVVIKRLLASPGRLATLPPATSLELVRVAMGRERFSALGLEDLPLGMEQVRSEDARWRTLAETCQVGQSVAAAQLWSTLGQKEETRWWTSQAFARLEASAATATAVEAASLARLIAATGQEAPAGGGAFLAAVACRGDLAGSSRDARDCAWLVRDAKALEQLQVAVTGPDGRPRPGTAVVMAYAAQMQDSLPSWQQAIEAGLSKAKQAKDGDGQAAWLIARAAASEAAAVKPAELRRRLDPTQDQLSRETVRRYNDLKAALEVAQSDTMRETVAVQLADYTRSRHRPGVGAEMLGSLAGRIKDEAIRQRLSTLAATLRREEDRRLLGEEQIREEHRDVVRRAAQPADPQP